ncbi:hypothetical protein EGM_07992 [Macaca fascicularis]|uniref:Uncharacterized protein n=2 Tax=Cercopithecidae TaxID=9527 RepID=A0A2K5URA3_MACFA|nr:hypothetical protein EGM_07992 [Macaca fascicularis]
MCLGTGLCWQLVPQTQRVWPPCPSVIAWAPGCWSLLPALASSPTLCPGVLTSCPCMHLSVSTCSLSGRPRSSSMRTWCTFS